MPATADDLVPIYDLFVPELAAALCRRSSTDPVYTCKKRSDELLANLNSDGCTWISTALLHVVPDVNSILAREGSVVCVHDVCVLVNCAVDPIVYRVTLKYRSLTELL
jgi:hypothetical protein